MSLQPFRERVAIVARKILLDIPRDHSCEGTGEKTGNWERVVLLGALFARLAARYRGQALRPRTIIGERGAYRGTKIFHSPKIGTFVVSTSQIPRQSGKKSLEWCVRGRPGSSVQCKIFAEASDQATPSIKRFHAFFPPIKFFLGRIDKSARSIAWLIDGNRMLPFFSLFFVALCPSLPLQFIGKQHFRNRIASNFFRSIFSNRRKINSKRLSFENRSNPKSPYLLLGSKKRERERMIGMREIEHRDLDLARKLFSETFRCRCIRRID